MDTVPPMTDVSEVLRRFGGAAAVADAFSIPVSTVWNWPWKGFVPAKWHLPLLRLARDRGVELSEDELLSTTSRGPDNAVSPKAIAASEA